MEIRKEHERQEHSESGQALEGYEEEEARVGSFVSITATNRGVLSRIIGLAALPAVLSPLQPHVEKKGAGPARQLIGQGGQQHSFLLADGLFTQGPGLK